MSGLFSFALQNDFLEKWKRELPPFGYRDGAGLAVGELTFLDKYSRKKEDGSKEEWWEVCARVINGMYSIQKTHCLSNRLPWNGKKAQVSAQEAFERMFLMKWLPPGRGLWLMGTEFVMRQWNGSGLLNCGFISTESMPRNNPAKPFGWLMEASMLGVGVGYDGKGAKLQFVIRKPLEEIDFYTIPDSREGWTESVCLLLNSYLIANKKTLQFDYSLIRPKGTIIRTFGGTAAGPEPLMRLHRQIRWFFADREGTVLTENDIADLGNMIGVCVVSGNIRRSAEIFLGDKTESFLNLKNGKLDLYHKIRMGTLDFSQVDWKAIDPHGILKDATDLEGGWGWMSNNSIFGEVGLNVDGIEEGIELNGEPGLFWLKMAQAYGRLKDPPTYADSRVCGVNPCVSGDTVVYTTNGYQRVKDLVGVPFEAIVDGQSYPSTESGFWVTRENVEAICIEFMLHGVEAKIDVTPNHKIMVYDNQHQKSLWVEAKDLDPQAHHLRLAQGGRTQILSLSEKTLEKVYDCTVSGVHAFDANGLYVANCGEQPLESYECCTLVEVFLNAHTSMEDFHRTLKYAYLYAKTVTLLPTHWEETNAVMQRNRRIGTGVSGIADFTDNRGLPVLREWLDSGYALVRDYDKIYSEWLCIRESVKVTTVKPSGTVSIVAGSSPGVHWTPGGEYFLRTIRFDVASPLLPVLEASGYRIEVSKYNPLNDRIVYFPIHSVAKRSEHQVSIFEKIDLAATAQYFWSDNSVSVTVTFSEQEKANISRVLKMYDGRLKAVSFLPLDHGYEQAPYTSITKEEYHAYADTLMPVDLRVLYLNGEDASGEKFCTTDKCEKPL